MLVLHVLLGLLGLYLFYLNPRLFLFLALITYAGALLSAYFSLLILWLLRVALYQIFSKRR
jgi:hypothetical protein